ncbi:MAG: phosphatase PAP2 family protein [Candidatus Ancillula sp.]|jgi:acid phosphatase (class A)|nr:phosphatase PAP2 family protein [Candidatus Ancillula sp.]
MLRSKKSVGFRVVIFAFIFGLVLPFTTSCQRSEESKPDNTGGGYLTDGQVIDSVELLNAAPKDGSAAKELDLEVVKKMKNLEGSSRWIQAAADANDVTKKTEGREEPGACEQFNCQIGININEKNTPTLVKLLTKVDVDGGKVSETAKKKYMLPRPFVTTDYKEVCSPHTQESLSKNGAYPSGHTTAGWLWGLTLAKVDPENASRIMERARQYGESRLVCNVHWLTDVQGGRDLASAVFADLQQSKDFQADVEKAAQEVKETRGKAETVKKNWATTLEITKKFAKEHPENETAKKVAELLEPLKEWSCEKEVEALAVDINSYIGRQ